MPYTLFLNTKPTHNRPGKSDSSPPGKHTTPRRASHLDRPTRPPEQMAHYTSETRSSSSTNRPPVPARRDNWIASPAGGPLRLPLRRHCRSQDRSFGEDDHRGTFGPPSPDRRRAAGRAAAAGPEKRTWRSHPPRPATWPSPRPGPRPGWPPFPAWRCGCSACAVPPWPRPG